MAIVQDITTSLNYACPQMLQHLFIKYRKPQNHKVELVAYHDCFYRNMYKYEFITLLDIDEESA